MLFRSIAQPAAYPSAPPPAVLPIRATAFHPFKDSPKGRDDPAIQSPPTIPVTKPTVKRIFRFFDPSVQRTVEIRPSVTQPTPKCSQALLNLAAVDVVQAVSRLSSVKSSGGLFRPGIDHPEIQPPYQRPVPELIDLRHQGLSHPLEHPLPLATGDADLQSAVAQT